MTEEEARKVASIIVRADQGCSNCVGELISLSKKIFPEFDWKQLCMDVDEDFKESVATGFYDESD